MADELEILQLALAARYRIHDELGRGGMATVYRAHDLRHDRAVALKVLKPALAEALGPRFLHEITLTAVARDLGETALPLFTAAPDGRTILYTRRDASVNELMLVENLR
jgi:serine/threonine protein kinase